MIRFNTLLTEVWDATLDILTSLKCLFRGLPLLVQARPKTPLRVMCVMAFDTVHQLRNDVRLPSFKVHLLSTFLDLGACANAALDRKSYYRREFHDALRDLKAAGLSLLVREYLQRLYSLERQRPDTHGGRQLFHSVCLYRESVVRLSLGMISAVVFELHNVAEGIEATHRDSDLRLLFQSVMQCQIIDDFIDYSHDLAAGLPGFLTSHSSLEDAIGLTECAARRYSVCPNELPWRHLFPLKVALIVLSAVTRLVIALGRWWYRVRIASRLTSTPNTS